MDAPFWLVGYSYLPRLSYPSLLMITNKRVHCQLLLCNPSHIYKEDLPRWVSLFRWWGHPYSRANFSPFYKLFISPCCYNSDKARQSEHARALLSLAKLRRQLSARVKRSTYISHINARQSCLGWEGGPLTREHVSSYKRGQKTSFVTSYWTRSAS